MANRNSQDGKQETGLSRALIRSTTIENIADLAGDVAEVVLDSKITDEVIKEIPVFGILFKIYKAGSSIRDLLFVKKVARFLQAAGEVSNADRQQFLEEMENDPEQEQKVGETVLLLLDRLDDFDKAAMIGKLFAAYVEKKIDFVLFQELATAVGKCSIHALHILLSEHVSATLATKAKLGTEGVQEIEIDIQGELYRSGLLSMPEVRRFSRYEYIEGGGRHRRGDADAYIPEYVFNKLALTLVQILVGREPNVDDSWHGAMHPR